MSTQHPVRGVLSSAAIPVSRPTDNLQCAGTGSSVGNCVGTVVAVLAHGDRLMSDNVLYAGPPLLGLSFLSLAPWIVRPENGLRAPVATWTLAISESVEPRLTKHGLRVPVVVRPVDGAKPFRLIVTLGGMRKKHVKDPEVGTLLALRQVEFGRGESAAVDELSARQKELMVQLKKQPRKLKSDVPILSMRRSPLPPKSGWAGGMLASTCLFGIMVVLGTTFTVTA